MKDAQNAAAGVGAGDDGVETVSSAFGYDVDEFVGAFQAAAAAADGTDEARNDALCGVARVVSREVRCFFADVYAGQVDAAPEATRPTTEFFRDKWADGRNVVRAGAGGK